MFTHCVRIIKNRARLTVRENGCQKYLTIAQIWVFPQKIGYNSACIGDMSQVLVSKWVFLRRTSFMSRLVQIGSRPTSVIMVTTCSHKSLASVSQRTASLSGCE